MAGKQLDFSKFLVDEVIVHEIPQAKAGEKDEHLELSEGPAPVQKNELNFFRERVTQSISSHGVASQFLNETESPVPEVVLALLQDVGDLVSQSQRVARHLYRQQPGNSPEGLLTALIGTVDTRPAVAIMKLQKQTGLRVQQARTAEGARTLSVKILNELMLTEKTRVFKVGVFARDSNGVVQARVSDEQLNSNASGGVAAFFMRVLGCKPAEAPAVLTRRFYEKVQGFINSEVSNGEAKLRYAQALRAELTSHVGSIEPASFITKYIDATDRDRLERYLRDQDVPLNAFSKDTTGIDRKIRTRSIKTGSGVSVKAPAEVFEELVSVEDLDGQGRVIVVRDSVVEV